MQRLTDALRALRIHQRPEAIERGRERMLAAVRDRFGDNVKVAATKVAAKGE